MLKIENIEFGYADHLILDGANLSIGQGETVGLTGHNGSGKSTLLKLIAGDLNCSMGKISVDGKDITGAGRTNARKEGVLFCPQKGIYFNSLTVKEHFKLFNLNLSHQKVNLLSMNIEPSTQAANLSGGQLKWLSLHLTLSSPGRVYLLDEPSAGLSKTILGSAKKKIITSLNKANAAAIIVDHDIEFLTEVSDRVLDISQITKK